MIEGDPVGRPYALGHMERLVGPRRGEALPRDLFVAAMNEGVGVNDRGRPGGSPLLVYTTGVYSTEPDAR